MLVCDRTKSTNLGQRRGLEVLETTGLQIFKHAMNKQHIGDLLRAGP